MYHKSSNAASATQLLTRRRLLQAGTLGLLGLDLPSLLRAEVSRGSGSIRSCILLYYYGGPSHLDTWDMKPNAPKEIRGEFQSIATKVPGIRICEHLPRSSCIVDKLAIVRSVHHPMRNHNAAAVEALCGRTPLGGDQELLNDDANSFPCYGSALSFLNPGRHNIPPHVSLPQPMYNVVKLPGQTAGFLGARHNPFQVNDDLTRPDFRVHELTLPSDLPPARMDDRRELLSIVENQTRGTERRFAGQGLAAHQDRAFDILASDTVRRAFDLSRESQQIRDRYGRDTLGQSLLLARRLVEGGVRFVNVNDKFNNGQTANWDSHENNFGRLKENLLPPADRAFSALIEDLDSRGLLETTLVIALAEFGRTPKINNNKGGRDHWPDCFSIVLAGGGVKGGVVHGASDRIGAYPALDPVSSGDIAATLFWRFGLEIETEIKDLTGRPYRLADGEPLRGLFA